MADWNKNMGEAPEYDDCWIYVPAFEDVHDEVTVASRIGEVWYFGDFKVSNGEISDQEDDKGQMIGPLAWAPITKPAPPVI